MQQHSRAVLRLISLCGLLVGTDLSNAAELVLVEDGVSLAPIVVFENAPPKTRRAAHELAEYVLKISGATPEVLEGRPDPLPERAIWVGYQPVLDGLFPGLDFDFQHPEAILIAANAKHLVIAGRDRWNPERLVAPGRNREIVGLQQEYGTLNAVYSFLQDHLQVRWLWPGPTGEDVLRQDRIAFAPFVERYHPQFRQRSSIFRLSALADNRGISQDWCRFQRLKLDSLSVPGGHGFTTWWNRFHESNPEFFALQPDGTRSGFPSPGNVKMCLSNPELWQQWLRDVETQLEQNPDQTIFHAAFNDSAHRGHCICEPCRAWDSPEAPPRQLEWRGLSQQYVALSDRDVTFANTLGRLLQDNYPERDFRVVIMAYGPTRPAPVATVPSSNVIVGNVGNLFWGLEAVDGSCPLGTRASTQFADWGKIAATQIWRPNTGNPAGWQQGQPDVAFERVGDAFRFVAEHGGAGIYVDTVWEYWATQGPLYYLMAQLAWDPRGDVQSILDDYYQRGFGPAAKPVKAYWTLLETTRNRKVDDQLAYAVAYDSTFFARADDLLNQAGARLADAPARYRERLSMVRAGLEFTRLMVDTREGMAAWRKSSNTDTTAAERVRQNWTQKAEIAKTSLMNFRFMRPGGRYAAGLHPDH